MILGVVAQMRMPPISPMWGVIWDVAMGVWLTVTAIYAGLRLLKARKLLQECRENAAKAAEVLKEANEVSEATSKAIVSAKSIFVHEAGYFRVGWGGPGGLETCGHHHRDPIAALQCRAELLKGDA